MQRWTKRAWLLALVMILAFAGLSNAQDDPIHWSAVSKTAQVKPGDTFKVELTMKVDEGWHVYSVTQAPPPIATRITVPDGQPFTLVGSVEGPAPHVQFDENFGINAEYYLGEATFTLTVKVAANAPSGKKPLKVQAYYQTCNDSTCLPPKRVPIDVAIEVVGGIPAPTTAAVPPTSGAGAAPPSPASVQQAASTAAVPIPAAGASAGSSPVSTPAKAASPASSGAAAPAAETSALMPISQIGRGNQSIWSFLWLAMTVGALSLLTPCVFPMVPITVSYFTKNAAGSRGKAIEQAIIYMIGIVLTFTALGMAMALFVGATSLNRFAANAWVNILISTIFIVFALNLFGFFELSMPSGLVNRLDSITRRQGGSQTIATLLMGLTFTLTSFTCTAPFIGTLLVMAAGGDWQWPLLGMLAFSTVFGLPFFILALMPQWMASLPKSGGWLNSVKVMMAFLEIAAAMKFVSNIDLVWGWGIFTHDVVLGTWIMCFVLMSFYILGLFRFPHDSPVKHVGVTRLAVSMLCGTIALWMLTGLNGKKLGEIEAFLPPASDALIAATPGGAATNELAWIMNDYEQALAKAKQESKLVFIDFTGYTCTNCRWMEANMFPREDVRAELRKYVLVRLYTDGDGAVFERQQQLQQTKYKTVALPYYAVVNPAGDTIASFPGLTRDPAQFVAFLQKGLRGPIQAALQ